ncbi:30S ribosomal protein S18 [bacterium]|nr:30S ribosomal protein S18 [bacterium]NUN46445.1 30S ribosomal protein S18 [bacterium]HMV25402.1 30S ribosomal protein S18 [bacterium]HMW33397.1 30S ribosomal protein S18 [bacterium]HMW36796.1 30S ribosomal protein S18 [bacterium]
MAEKKFEKKRREPRGGMNKPKHCPFCEEKALYVDYRDTKRIMKFTSEQGKILARRTSGVCATHQRQLVSAVKYARHLAMIPFVSDMAR